MGSVRKYSRKIPPPGLSPGPRPPRGIAEGPGIPMCVRPCLEVPPWRGNVVEPLSLWLWTLVGAHPGVRREGAPTPKRSSTVA